MKYDKRLKKIPHSYQTKVKKIIFDLVETIKVERLKKGLSQEQVAELLNIQLKTYQAYEQGARKPSLEVLVLMFLTFNYELKTTKKELKKSN